MAYIKQDWTTGDKITAEKLNHMEDGIEAAAEVDASELVDNNSLIKAENNKLDVKYNALKNQITADLTTNSNYLVEDGVYKCININYGSLRDALADSLFVGQPSALSAVCGRTMQVDSNKKLNVVLGNLVSNSNSNSRSNYIDVVNGVLDVDVTSLATGLATDSTFINDSLGHLDVNLNGIKENIFSSETGTYGNYITIDPINLSESVPTISYMEDYITAQGYSSGQGNIVFTMDDNGGSGESVINLMYYPEGEEHPSYIQQIPMVIYNFSGFDDIPVLCCQNEYGYKVPITHVVYHDANGFYTVDKNGERQSITV